jgi:predicted ArsR family transcriptional regulator
VPVDPSLQTHKALSDVSRFRILEELRAAGPMDSRELGQRIGLHPNTIRSHVEQLMQAHLVRTITAPASGPGRPRVLYEASADTSGGHESGYRLLAQILASYLASIEQPQAVAESAGRAWGSYLTERPQPFSEVSVAEATQMVVQLFTELGFMPESVEDGAETKILLHRCPFRQVAESNREVACAVHLGMLKGALAAMGAPLEAARLEPFVEPNLCVAHLRRYARRAGASARGARRQAPATGLGQADALPR